MIKGWISRLILGCYFLTNLLGPNQAYAQSLHMPAPGGMLQASPAYIPLTMKGLRVHLENPLLFDFILDTGKSGLQIDSQEFRFESKKLIKYFLAALTIKEEDLWVNLSPFEKDRIVTDDLGKTELGRDMLAQDYVLKQLTASMIYPEKELGKSFWEKVYNQAKTQFGTTDIPVDTFNKVWITADTAKVLERNNTAYVVGAHLKVMLESDYLTERNLRPVHESQPTSELSKQIIREIILPALEKEVNEGQNFAPLRQIFYTMILSTWYKQALKDALLNQVYSNRGKTIGVESGDPMVKEKVYAQYLEAYKQGVFNYIREDFDATTGEAIPRQYFSGGLSLEIPKRMSVDKILQPNDNVGVDGDMAMVTAKVDRARSIFDEYAKSVLSGRIDARMVADFQNALATEISQWQALSDAEAVDALVRVLADYYQRRAEAPVTVQELKTVVALMHRRQQFREKWEAERSFWLSTFSPTLGHEDVEVVRLTDGKLVPFTQAEGAVGKGAFFDVPRFLSAVDFGLFVLRFGVQSSGPVLNIEQLSRRMAEVSQEVARQQGKAAYMPAKVATGQVVDRDAAMQSFASRNLHATALNIIQEDRNALRRRLNNGKPTLFVLDMESKAVREYGGSRIAMDNLKLLVEQLLRGYLAEKGITGDIVNNNMGVGVTLENGFVAQFSNGRGDSKQEFVQYVRRVEDKLTAQQVVRSGERLNILLPDMALPGVISYPVIQQGNRQYSVLDDLLRGRTITRTGINIGLLDAQILDINVESVNPDVSITIMNAGKADIVVTFKDMAQKQDDRLLKGGIDLNAKKMELGVTREGNGVRMAFDPAMVAKFERGNFVGVIPVILQITPMKDPLSVLGLTGKV